MNIKRQNTFIFFVFFAIVCSSGVYSQKRITRMITASVDQNCNPDYKEFSVPDGYEAGNFRLGKLEKGTACATGGQIRGRGFAIVRLVGNSVLDDPAFQFKQFLGERPQETPVALADLVLPAGEYVLYVGGGAGAQVSLEYQLFPATGKTTTPLRPPVRKEDKISVVPPPDPDLKLKECADYLTTSAKALRPVQSSVHNYDVFEVEAAMLTAPTFEKLNSIYKKQAQPLIQKIRELDLKLEQMKRLAEDCAIDLKTLLPDDWQKILDLSVLLNEDINKLREDYRESIDDINAGEREDYEEPVEEGQKDKIELKLMSEKEIFEEYRRVQTKYLSYRYKSLRSPQIEIRIDKFDNGTIRCTDYLNGQKLEGEASFGNLFEMQKEVKRMAQYIDKVYKEK
jgi:hypothetical protein